MRKLFVLLCLSLLYFTDLSAETGKRFHVGLDVGGCPITEEISGYRIGGGIGVQVTKRVGLIAEFGYAVATDITNPDWPYYSYERTLKSFPLSGSILFITPVTEGFSAHIGLGLGYNFIQIRSSGGKTNWGGIAPHVSLAFEAKVSKRTAIYASVKEIIGTAKHKSSSGREYNMQLSGQEIKAGLRFYF